MLRPIRSLLMKVHLYYFLTTLLGSTQVSAVHPVAYTSTAFYFLVHRHDNAELHLALDLACSRKSVLATPRQEAKQVKYTFHLVWLLGKLTFSLTPINGKSKECIH